MRTSSQGVAKWLGKPIKLEFFVMRLTGKLSLAIVATAAICAHASSFSLNGTLWNEVTKVDPVLLYSVALVESRRTDHSGRNLRPWPWALNVSGKSHYFDTRSEAEVFLTDLLEKGIRNVDVGPLQINLRWNGHLVTHPLDLFDLSTSIRVGEQVLYNALMSSPDDDALAVGRYHNWSDENRARAYGLRVLRIREALLNSQTGGF